MKNFFLLFTIIFVPFAWFLYRALRYTKETIGEDSPLYTEQTYHFSAYSYFCKFYKVLLAIVLAEMLFLIDVMTRAAVNQQEPLIFLFVLLFVAFAGFLGFFFYFDWQYWTITRNILITLNPLLPGIVVASPRVDRVLTPENVLRIEHHVKKITSAKDPLGGYGYFLFYTRDGQVTLVNDVFLIHVEFLKRFFSTVPSGIIYHKLPWVGGINWQETP